MGSEMRNFWVLISGRSREQARHEREFKPLPIMAHIANVDKSQFPRVPFRDLANIPQGDSTRAEPAFDDDALFIDQDRGQPDQKPDARHADRRGNSNKDQSQRARFPHCRPT